jgi:peptidoglycan/xylan/chitin deacetylase (PgdA/CDA1 family)
MMSSGTAQKRARPEDRAPTPAGLAILMYHALGAHRSAISIPPSTFEWQMRWLHDRRYAVVPLSTLAKRLRAGERPAGPTAVITFDDGMSSVYTTAFPVLARYRFPATVFIVSGYCGKSNDWPSQPAAVPRHALISWSQIREMDRYGLEFGAHTVTHPLLDRLTPDELSDEVVGSKTMIEDALGHAVELFAYPYGRFNDAVKALVRRTYLAACGTRLGLVRPGSDPWELARVEAQCLGRRWLFGGLPSPLLPLYLEGRRVVRTASSFVLRRPWI